MDRITSPFVAWGLTAGVLVCLIALAVQHRRVTELEASRQTLAAELEAAVAELEVQSRALSELAEREATLAAEVAGLTRETARLARGNASTDTAAVDLTNVPDTLVPGIYVLAPGGSPDDELADLTSYHVVTVVRAGDFEQKLHFGAARAGLTSWQFYFDYDGDARVDSDMLEEFVGSIPFGGYVSGVFDAERAQGVYERFLRLADTAQFIAPERIPEQGGLIARQLWTFVTGSSEQLAAWISATLGGDASEPAPAPQP